MILHAENFRAYATVDDLALAYDYFYKNGSLFSEVNGRRVIENNGLVSMKIAPTKKLCLRMIVSMATGTVLPATPSPSWPSILRGSIRPHGPIRPAATLGWCFPSVAA